MALDWWQSGAQEQICFSARRANLAERRNDLKPFSQKPLQLCELGRNMLHGEAEHLHVGMIANNYSVE